MSIDHSVRLDDIHNNVPIIPRSQWLFTEMLKQCLLPLPEGTKVLLRNAFFYWVPAMYQYHREIWTEEHLYIFVSDPRQSSEEEEIWHYQEIFDVSLGKEMQRRFNEQVFNWKQRVIFCPIAEKKLSEAICEKELRTIAERNLFFDVKIPDDAMVQYYLVPRDAMQGMF